MKKMISKAQPIRLAGSIVLRLLGIVLCATLFSFSIPLGGDTYEIHLNGKLLLRQQVWKQVGVTDISLDPKPSDGELAVDYRHCGQSGKGRILSIQNEKHSILKEWRFLDTKTGEHIPMTCSVKEIAALYGKHGKLSLYYASQELPEGKLLVSLTMAGDVTSRR